MDALLSKLVEEYEAKEKAAEEKNAQGRIEKAKKTCIEMFEKGYKSIFKGRVDTFSVGEPVLYNDGSGYYVIGTISTTPFVYAWRALNNPGYHGHEWYEGHLYAFDPETKRCSLALYNFDDFAKFVRKPDWPLILTDEGLRNIKQMEYEETESQASKEPAEKKPWWIGDTYHVVSLSRLNELVTNGLWPEVLFATPCKDGDEYSTTIYYTVKINQAQFKSE
jgi:hypothetical protein